MTLQEIQYKAQSIISKWRDDDSAPYIEFVEELAHMIVPEPSEDLEEAALKFADMEYMVGDVDRSALYKGFWHGAKWQKEKDDKELSEKIAGAYQLGLADKEKQLMQEAVEGVYDSYPAAIYLETPAQGIEHGNKVCIIICKKED